MKTKVLIIEDNFAKYFTTKQVLEATLKLQVQAIDVSTGAELLSATKSLNPDLIVFRPNGGVAELLTKMKKRRTNRRNTEITLLLTQDFEEEQMQKFQDYVTQLPRRVADAA